MIERLRTAVSTETEPYWNIALEEALLRRVAPGECILYLWQNRRTVVIGRNQNAWKECRAEALEADGGFLARRLSGGGAVFHDLGNLNFTFLAREAGYDVNRQLDVLLAALRRLGLPAEKSGRNDVTVEGRKVSGNAFYQSGGHCCHHGTILVRTIREDLEKYLKVSGEKLQSKGVSSVQARVANLCDFLPDICVETVRGQMLSAFEEVYGLPTESYPLLPELLAETERRRERFASWDWRFGRPIPFTWEGTARFAWGGVTLRLQVDQGRVSGAEAESDAMDADWIASLPKALIGLPFVSQVLAGAIPGDTEAARDVRELLYQQMGEPGERRSPGLTSKG